MFTSDKMAEGLLTLEVWQGDWDLPSVDCDCLAALVRNIVTLVLLACKETGLNLFNQLYTLYT